jgi:CubicO group peptidase (beta-lactamase class C family)
MGWRLQPEGEARFSCRAFAAALTSDDTRNRAGVAQYKSPNTDIAGWIAERVSGRSLRSHLIDIVEAAGFEGTFHISTDCDGVPVIAGGGSLTARDLARHGRLIARGGIGVGGIAVGSPAFLERTRQERGAPRYEGRDDFTYHNQLVTNGRWVGHGGYGGQYLLIDPDTCTVVVFFSVLEDEGGYDETYYPEVIAMAEAIVDLG